MDIARSIVVFALSMLSLSCFSAAISSQEMAIDLRPTEITSLVSVSGNFTFPAFVPNQEYRAPLSVRLSIPAEAVAGMTSDKLVVYVSLRPKRNDSALYFRNGSATGGEYFLALSCNTNADCAGQASANRTMNAYFIAQSGRALSSDGIIVNASLTPLSRWQTGNDLVFNKTAFDEIEQVEAGVITVAGEQGFNTTDLEALSKDIDAPNESAALVLKAIGLAKAGDYAGAANALLQARQALEQFMQKQVQAGAAQTAATQTTANASAQNRTVAQNDAVGMATGFATAMAKPPLIYGIAAVLGLCGIALVASAWKGRGKKSDDSLNFLN